MSWPWNPGQRSLKVIETETNRSATYDFLLTFHSNHGSISYRFRDKRRFQSKIAKLSNPRVFNAPAKGVPLRIEYWRNGSKTRMMGYTRRSKTFSDKFSRLDTQYRRVTDRRTDRQTSHDSKDCAMQSVARVKSVVYSFLNLHFPLQSGSTIEDTN